MEIWWWYTWCPEDWPLEKKEKESLHGSLFSAVSVVYSSDALFEDYAQPIERDKLDAKYFVGEEYVAYVFLVQC